MVRTKAAVRRLDDFRVVARQKKNSLPVQNKTSPTRARLNITKNRQILKTINVRRKSKYFNGRNRLIF